MLRSEGDRHQRDSVDKPAKRKRSGQPVTVVDVVPGAEGDSHRMEQQWLVPRTRDAQSLWIVGGEG